MLRLSQTMLSALLLVDATTATAFESRWTAGLDISSESLTGQTGVNGVLFLVERATGRDVPLLADRIFRDWQRESGSGHVLPLNEAGWSLFSRIHQSQSQVVQWRGTGREAELLWSVTDLRQVEKPPPIGAVPRPQGCSWLPPVHGRVQKQAFLETSGYCKKDVTIVLRDLKQLLSGNRWTVHEAGSGVLQIERGNRKAQIVLTAVSDAGHARMTNVIVLELGIDSVRSP